jgi:flagellin
MGLVLNHNMPAIYSAYVLDKNYGRLAVNVERLSSGLRVNSAEDDPAGFGIRELMRSELTTMEQGLRNAADGVSLLQTAEGAMAVIDEKLLRMRELAEQGATGTYTTLQREIINSEYQAMAAEIDRIANSTTFNGVKLLDGTAAQMHRGQGLKIHFGLGDSSSEDYYFVRIDDVRATTVTGLKIGGDAKNDVWSTVSLSGPETTDGCCGGGVSSLSQPVSAWTSGSIFSYGYNWDEGQNIDQNLSQGRYVGGAYQLGSGASLEQLLDTVNRGTQSRIRADFRIGDFQSDLVGGEPSANAHRICLGDEVYYIGNSALALQDCTSSTTVTVDLDNYPGLIPADALVQAINTSSQSFWAQKESFSYRSGYVSVYIFNRQGGNYDDLTASDQQLGPDVTGSASLQTSIVWHNDETGVDGTDGALFGNGGESWGTLRARPSGYGTWGLSLEGRDVGLERDLWILNAGASSESAAYDLNFEGWSFGSQGFGLAGAIAGLSRQNFVEVQNASDGDWLGASIRTQSNAQTALEAVNLAIAKKDAIRAKLGAVMNRLENTMTNLETMHETLQAAESRISDVDVATEMTDFVRNQVLSQAAVSILSQANALPEMALSLLNG